MGDGGREKKDDGWLCLLEELIVGLSVGRRRESSIQRAHSLVGCLAAIVLSSFARTPCRRRSDALRPRRSVSRRTGGRGRWQSRCRRRRRSRSTFGRTEAHHHHQSSSSLPLAAKDEEGSKGHQHRQCAAAYGELTQGRIKAACMLIIRLTLRPSPPTSRGPHAACTTSSHAPSTPTSKARPTSTRHTAPCTTKDGAQSA